MDSVIKILSELVRAYSNRITLYKNVDLKILMKSIGKVPGKFDSDLLELLKFTNGASILDYCFLGFKNPRLGVDIDKFMFELWSSHEFTAGRVLGFMITSTSETFGYLIDVVDDKGRHPIVYCSDNRKLYLLASSFSAFMISFVGEISDTLKNTTQALPLYIEKEGWPKDTSYWKSNDPDLEEICKNEKLKKIKDLVIPDFK